MACTQYINKDAIAHHINVARDRFAKESIMAEIAGKKAAKNLFDFMANEVIEKVNHDKLNNV